MSLARGNLTYEQEIESLASSLSLWQIMSVFTLKKVSNLFVTNGHRFIIID